MKRRRFLAALLALVFVLSAVPGVVVFGEDGGADVATYIEGAGGLRVGPAMTACTDAMTYLEDDKKEENGALVEVAAGYVDIMPVGTVDIGGLNGNAISAAINSAAQNENVVTVTGTATITQGIVLNIPTGVTVNWQADLSTYHGITLVNINNGDGTFHLEPDGRIVNTSIGGAGILSILASVRISGGVIAAPTNAVFNSRADIEISGGNIDGWIETWRGHISLTGLVTMRGA